MSDLLTDIQSKIDALATKAGADKFISDKLVAIEPELPKLSSSMAFQCGIIVGRMKAEPAVVVAEEIAKLKARKAEIEKELKPIGEIKR